MLIALAGVSIACGELPVEPVQAPTWTGNVGAALSRCQPCHQETRSFFALATTCREDGEPWIAIGDRSSPVLQVLSREDHPAVLSSSELETLRSWIEDSSLTFTSDRAHPPGWSLDHARPLDPRPCFSCHQAPEPRGGAIACTTCHDRPFGLGRCDNCHDHRDTPCGSPAEKLNNALHRTHLAGGSDGAFPRAECADCHRVPNTLLARGHFDDGTPRAEVQGDFRYEPDTQTCDASICHAQRAQTWSAPSGERCDRCHGAPPPDHASDRCDDCHRGATHLNRTLDVGIGCDDCHRTESLSGAHDIHLSRGTFRGPIGCETCHLVPDSRDAAGHLDSPPPAEVRLLGAAATFHGVLSPHFDANSARCADVGCHGAALDGGRSATEPWDSTATLACGSCHALPPVLVRNGAGVHLPTADTDCGICHRDPSGAPITDDARAISEAGRDVHANGHVDLADGW